jgi:deoxyribodipyrimidine photo-lyase
MLDGLEAAAIIEQAHQAGAETIVTAEAPVGPVRDGLAAMEPALNGAGLKLRQARRDWDDAAWPHATKGFFPFKKKIPELLERAGLAGG